MSLEVFLLNYLKQEMRLSRFFHITKKLILEFMKSRLFFMVEFHSEMKYLNILYMRLKLILGKFGLSLENSSQMMTRSMVPMI